MSKPQMRSDYPEQKKEKKPNKVKATMTLTVSTTARVLKNTEVLVQAIALLVVTIFSYTQLSEVSNQIWYYTILASLIVVGLRASVELVKFLSKE
jgi:hypothetical protein